MGEQLGLLLRVGLERLRVIVIAGLFTGVLIGGVGGRLAMLLLRLTSPDGVRGVTSDDGFPIGEVTLSGTYDLLLVGGFIGLLGAGIYLLVAPWLIGPVWLRRTTTASAAGAVVGSMLVHADGVDFTLLKPTWLAVALFVAVPGLFGLVVGVVADRVAQPTSWTATGRRRWAVPLVLVACFPPVLVVVAFVAVVVGLFTLMDGLGEWLRQSVVRSMAVRGAWLLIAVLGLGALARDIAELS